jgi:hypothetical protein
MLRLSELTRRAFSWRGRRRESQHFSSVRGCPVRAHPDELADRVPDVRARLKIGAREIGDADIVLCLRAIRARKDRHGRWLAAFNSPVGQVIAGRGAAAAADLQTLIAIASRGRE